jgi:hypothetical protein
MSNNRIALVYISEQSVDEGFDEMCCVLWSLVWSR